MNAHDSMLIQWYESDQAFLVTFPELSGPYHPHAHGETYEEAARNGREVLELLLEYYRDENRPLAEPNLFRFSEKALAT